MKCGQRENDLCEDLVLFYYASIKSLLDKHLYTSLNPFFVVLASINQQHSVRLGYVLLVLYFSKSFCFQNVLNVKKSTQKR